MARFRASLLLWLVFVTPAVAATTAAMDAAVNSTASTASSQYGSPGAVNQNISTPGTNSATLMKTVDGSKSFDGSLVCPSSSQFLSIASIPSATNDLALIIKQQTNLAAIPPATGFNLVYTVPVTISGVCANGFVSCDAGTWQNCTKYQWTADASLQVGIAADTTNNWSGCFCINSSCGYNLATDNYSYLLGILGSGIATTIQKGYPQMTISQVKIVPPAADYYGQQAGNCKSAPGGSGSGSPASYWNSPALISGDGSSVNGSNNTYYADMSTLQARKGGGLQARTCTAQWQWTVATQLQTASKAGTGSMCIVFDFMGGLINPAGTSTYNVQFGATTSPSYPGCPATTPISADSFDLAALSLTLPANALTGALYKSSTVVGNYTDPNCSSSPTTVNGAGVMVAISSCTMAKLHTGTYNYTANLTYQYDVETLTFTDSCTSYINDPKCQLKDEKEYDAGDNAVVSYKNYNPTGLKPLASSTTRTTALGTYSKTKDWWKAERTYMCSGAPPLDTSVAQKRSAAIQSSVQAYAGGGTITYNDYRCDATLSSCTSIGNAGTLTFTPTVTSNSCEYACKVQIQIQNTQAAQSSELNPELSHFDVFSLLSRQHH